MLPTSVNQQRGFALVIALSLMAFILVLLLSITTLVQVEIKSSDISNAKMLARQNALLSAHLALGNLQRYGGEDQRITARGDLFASTDPSKREHTAIWSSEPSDRGTLLAWLSSDWSIDQADYGETPAPGIAGADAVELVALGTVDAANNPNDVIRVTTANTQIIGSQGSTTGRYAWWIADENTKANIRPLDSASTLNNTESRYRASRTLTNSSSAKLETLTGFNGDVIDQDDFIKVIDDANLPQAGFNEEGLVDRYHDYTLLSFGLATNPRDGGFKKDLSLAFEMTDADFNASVFAAAGSNVVNSLGNYGIGLQTEPIFIDGNGGRGPTWHLLRDYYTFYQRVDSPMNNPSFPAQHMEPNHVEIGTSSKAPGSIDSKTDFLGYIYQVHNGGIDNDPLRSTTLPVPTRATYGPYLHRWQHTLALGFGDILPGETTDDPATQFVDEREDRRPTRIYHKPVFAIHNPYNIEMEHYGVYGSIDLLRGLVRLNSLAGHGRTSSPNDNFLGLGDTGANESVLKVPPGTIDPGRIELYQAVAFDTPATFSEPGLGEAKDFFNLRTSGGGIAGSPPEVPIHDATTGGPASPNVSARLTPFGAANGWQVSFRYAIGSETSPVDETVVDSSAIVTDYFGVSGMSMENGELLSAETWLNANQHLTPMNTEDHVILNNDPTNAPDAPKPFATYDYYLKDAFDGTAYPAFTHANPIAPLAAAFNTYDRNTAYPVLAPQWQLEITEPKNTIGTLGIDNYNGTLNAYWGDSRQGGAERTAPLEIPIVPPMSIGKLQSANLSLLGSMPALAIGNSFASPYLPRDQIDGTFTNISGFERAYHDLSYYLNDRLWDSYFFSSYSVPYDTAADDFDTTRGPGVSFDAAFNPSTAPASVFRGALPNPRMKLLTKADEDLAAVRTKLFNGDQARPSGVDRAAENLLIEGAFNIHSTSVEAWSAVLAAGRGNSVFESLNNTEITTNADQTPLSRSAQPAANAFNGDSSSNEAWSGYRNLSDAEIRSLATEIVAELKRRTSDAGQPFTSMGAFVNRRLSNDAFGLSGLLQTAIDNAGLNQAFETTRNLTSADLSQALGSFPEPTNIEQADGSGRAAGSSAAAHINQADILQGIGSFIQIRSDTFKIRSYGDTRDPVSGDIVSRAICELIVQRTPAPVYPGATSPDDVAYWTPSTVPAEEAFGRRFKIISMRFLDENQI